MPGVASRLKCRGQVIESTRMVTYEVAIKELGYGPEPYAIADALMYADGKPIVEITDMSLRLVRDRPRASSSGSGTAGLATASRAATGPTPVCRPASRSSPSPTGKPSEAFGDRYRPFDDGRFIARLPGPPYQFLDRVVDGRRASRGRWRRAATAEAEYDVPADAWYFEADRQDRVPFAVLLEAALQPCGWLVGLHGLGPDQRRAAPVPQPRRDGRPASSRSTGGPAR